MDIIAPTQPDLFLDNQLFSNPIETVRSSLDAEKRGMFSEEMADIQLEKWVSYCKSQCSGRNADITVLSLFDASGVWSAPYVLAGYDVHQLDIQNGVDIDQLTAQDFHDAGIDRVDILLTANPCTDFAWSGARWHKEKDASGQTQKSIDQVHHTMDIIEYFDPIIWALENPGGRIRDLCGLPDPAMYFQPHHYGDPYTKFTQLFGKFNPELPTCNVEPTKGSWIHTLRGDVPEQKRARSTTPEGFAYSFFMANQLHLLSDDELNRLRYKEWDE